MATASVNDDDRQEQFETDAASDQTDSEYSDDGAESEDSNEDDDMEEEPKLRYRRVGAGVRDLLDKDAASALRVSDKFVVCALLL